MKLQIEYLVQKISIAENALHYITLHCNVEWKAVWTLCKPSQAWSKPCGYGFEVGRSRNYFKSTGNYGSSLHLHSPTATDAFIAEEWRDRELPWREGPQKKKQKGKLSLLGSLWSLVCVYRHRTKCDKKAHTMFFFTSFKMLLSHLWTA